MTDKSSKLHNLAKQLHAKHAKRNKTESSPLEANCSASHAIGPSPSVTKGTELASMTKHASCTHLHAKDRCTKQSMEPSAFDLPSLRDFVKLPLDMSLSIEGHLLKRNSCLRACIAKRWSSHFFRLEGSRLLWWRRKTRTCMPAAGCIDLLADDVEVRVLESGAFELSPRSGVWKTSKFINGWGRGSRAGVVLNAEDSEHSLEQWLKCLRAHGAR
jgi:hypothetical protein